MKRRRILLLTMVTALVLAAAYGTALIRRGFTAAGEPSAVEKLMARSVRRLAVPSGASSEKNPLPATPDNLKAAGEIFTARCAGCHGIDGSGQTKVGRNLCPKPPDLRSPPTQDLTDGEIHYVIQNGVRLTGMPAWGNPHEEQGDNIWKLVLFIRNLRQPALAGQSGLNPTLSSAHYTGSLACK